MNYIDTLDYALTNPLIMRLSIYISMYLDRSDHSWIKQSKYWIHFMVLTGVVYGSAFD